MYLVAVHFSVNFAEKIMKENKYIRHIVAYGHYFKDFKKGLSKMTLMKIYEVFIYIMTTEMVPTKFLKSIKGHDGLYEIRVEEGGNIYRIFCCFDEGDLVILFNAFQKKTNKTPENEISRAERIMKEYFNKKNEQ